MNDQDKSNLKKIMAILIDEISMVDADLFIFLSNTFARIHKNNLIFGGVSILVVGDLAQLLPIRPGYVFQSPTWRKFFPFFLILPQRQQNDLEFYNVLQEIRTGHLSSRTINIINSKISPDNNPHELYDTTHIVNTGQAADTINEILCDHLPVDNTRNDPITSIAKDTLNFEALDDDHTTAQFKHQTNLPHSVHLQEGARVMFLNNKLFDDEICNGTIGISLMIQTLKSPFPSSQA